MRLIDLLLIDRLTEVTNQETEGWMNKQMAKYLKQWDTEKSLENIPFSKILNYSEPKEIVKIFQPVLGS